MRTEPRVHLPRGTSQVSLIQSAIPARVGLFPVEFSNTVARRHVSQFEVFVDVFSFVQ